jgi:hypothetical protein
LNELMIWTSCGMVMSPAVPTQSRGMVTPAGAALAAAIAWSK